MEPRTGYATLGDQHIAYQIIGNGPTDLIVTAGWWSPFDVEWEEPTIRAFYQQLARFSRVIRLDRRGMGASDPIPLDALPPWESLADEIAAVMDAVGSRRAAVLAAGSAGPAAALFAATRPDRTEGLILWHTTVRWLRDDDYPFGMDPEEMRADSEASREEWGTGETLQRAFPSRAADPEFKKFNARVERATTSPAAIRTGIHTGEIETRGGDVGGIAVHLAARIMAEAHADEILVSRTVKDLVVGSDLSFRDRGTHALKGIDEAWHLYAVAPNM
jgi:pimeloyl-ACP methyl ester carboxylesterase